MRTVRRIGDHFIEGGLYQDEEGRYYCDCHREPKDDGTIEVCILCPSDDPDGEPVHIVTAKLENPPTEREKREKAFQFEYMMLSRLQQDARAYFGTGNEEEDKWDCRYHNANNIWGTTIESHVKAMREYWDKIPEDIKPEWCTEAEIEEYERKVNSKK